MLRGAAVMLSRCKYVMEPTVTAVIHVLSQLLIRFALMGLTGIGTYYAIIFDSLLLQQLSGQWPAPFEAGPVLAFVGAGAVGLLALSGFGYPGMGGWAIAAATALATTFGGAALAGTLVMPGIGTTAAVSMVTTAIIARPPVLLIWAGLMAGLHLLQCRSRLRDA